MKVKVEMNKSNAVNKLKSLVYFKGMQRKI